MPIRILAPEVASQIAAGEVVERPASAVKELIENAIDAHARSIVIEAEAGGRRLLRVSDDGDGIPPEEFPLAVARHATSKLSQAQDLEHIQTLGFRGEALASIAAVSRLTLTSRTAMETVGLRIQVDGGKEGAAVKVGSPKGTVVQVEDLFHNVPARLKFLKNESAERRQIETVVVRFALAYPQIRFRLAMEGKEALHTTGSGDQREALAAVFGLDAAASMIEILSLPNENGIEVNGFISPPDLSRGNRKDILLYVNGRLIGDASLMAAVVQAYHTLLMVGRFPMAAIFLRMPTEEVDVNVHPAKAEVRFRESDKVFSAVQRAVRQTLLTRSPIPSVAPVQWEKWDSPPERLPNPDWMLAHPGIERDVREDARNEVTTPMPGAERIPVLKVIGQIGLAYIVAEGPDGLYLIDQHAAHERVLFDALRKQMTTNMLQQTLLSPEVVELSLPQATVLAGQVERLAKLGFAVEPFGVNAFRVRAIPELLAGMSPSEALLAVVEDFSEDETPLAKEAEARLAARICKRAAVKAGHALGAEEQTALVRKLEESDSPRTCPHGRPTMIHLSVSLLERQFGRRG